MPIKFLFFLNDQRGYHYLKHFKLLKIKFASGNHNKVYERCEWKIVQWNRLLRKREIMYQKFLINFILQFFIITMKTHKRFLSCFTPLINPNRHDSITIFPNERCETGCYMAVNEVYI